VGGNSNSTAFTGTISGSGNFIKAGIGTLSTGSLAHTGLTTVSGGTLNVNGSVTGSVLVNSDSMLSGNTAIGGNLILNAGGTLSPGNSPGTTTVAGNFMGGGILNVEVQVNNAAAPVNGTTHDFLNITGNITGVSALNMLPGGTPVLTSGKGIELVRVGGTTSPTAFGLNAPLVLDGITYALQVLPNQAGSSSYFLQSVLPDDLLGHATMLTAGRRMLARCHRGEERASAQGASKGVRSWAKYGAGSMKTGPDTGLHTDQTFSCGAGGIDTATGSDLRLGIVGGYGSTEVDVLTIAGRAKLDGDLGLIEAQASYVKNGMFLSLSAGYASTDWIFDGLQPGIYAAAVDGMIGSLMAGHEWDLGWDLKIAVSGEISYDGTSCAMPCVLYSQELGSTYSTMAEENNWRAGLSAKLADTSGAFRPFASVSWSDDIDGGSTVSRRAGVSIVADTAPNLMAARVGFEAEVSTNFGVFADVGIAGAVADPDKGVSGFDGQAGLRFSW
jgi:outer membrane autotransporter protein